VTPIWEDRCPKAGQNGGPHRKSGCSPWSCPSGPLHRHLPAPSLRQAGRVPNPRRGLHCACHLDLCRSDHWWPEASRGKELSGVHPLPGRQSCRFEQAPVCRQAGLLSRGFVQEPFVLQPPRSFPNIPQASLLVRPQSRPYGID